MGKFDKVKSLIRKALPEMVTASFVIEMLSIFLLAYLAGKVIKLGLLPGASSILIDVSLILSWWVVHSFIESAGRRLEVKEDISVIDAQHVEEPLPLELPPAMLIAYPRLMRGERTHWSICTPGRMELMEVGMSKISKGLIYVKSYGFNEDELGGIHFMSMNEFIQLVNYLGMKYEGPG